jgi:hypothetical protein
MSAIKLGIQPEDVTKVATPLCCMSCSYVGVSQLSNWERPEDVTKVASLPLWMFCGYLCRSLLVSKWEKNHKISEVATLLSCMFCGFVDLLEWSRTKQNLKMTTKACCSLAVSNSLSVSGTRWHTF